jgi:hypothetical protein
MKGVYLGLSGAKRSDARTRDGPGRIQTSLQIAGRMRAVCAGVYAVLVRSWHQKGHAEGWRDATVRRWKQPSLGGRERSPPSFSA